MTVERKTGELKEHKGVELLDLPGIYSLSPYSPEEVITQRYLLDEKPDLVVDVVDATNMERVSKCPCSVPCPLFPPP